MKATEKIKLLRRFAGFTETFGIDEDPASFVGQLWQLGGFSFDEITQLTGGHRDTIKELIGDYSKFLDSPL